MWLSMVSGQHNLELNQMVKTQVRKWCIRLATLVVVASGIGLGGCTSVKVPFTQRAVYEEPGAPVAIAPNHEHIRYTGRVHLTAAQAHYDWPNTQIEFRARAPKVIVKFKDGINDYNVFVDGHLQRVIKTTATKTDYSIDLNGSGQHVLVTKRTGANFGAGSFLGLEFPMGGKILSLPKSLGRSIEFIGDSYTVGYGNEGPGLDCKGEYRPYENSYLSFAPIVARALGAYSHSIAISGKGAVRNYGDENTTSKDPLPLFYGRTVSSREDLSWSFKPWKPDAVVIKLGTNDHSTEPSPPASVFIQGIHDLIAEVNQGYGKLPIFLMADSSLSQVIERMQRAANEQVANGNEQVVFVQVTHPPQEQLGCDWHPLVAGHEAMAKELAAAIKSRLNW